MLFKNKRFLITGGTGSFGSATIQKLLDQKVREIVIFSRDEKKQHDLRLSYKGNDKLNFIVLQNTCQGTHGRQCRHGNQKPRI